MPHIPVTPSVRLFGLDIETDTTVDGLDPAVAAVVAVALVGAERAWHFDGPERQLLTSLDRTIKGLGAAVITTWNGARFDLPFLSRRAHECGVALGLRLEQRGAAAHTEGDGHGPGYRAGWWQADHLDGYRLYRNDVARVLGTSCGLKPMARIVGLTPVVVDRSTVHELDPATLAAYVESDARITRELVVRRVPGAWAFLDRL